MPELWLTIKLNSNYEAYFIICKISKVPFIISRKYIWNTMSKKDTWKSIKDIKS